MNARATNVPVPALGEPGNTFAASTPSTSPSDPERGQVRNRTRRLHYIDWLRVLAVLLLFPFHTGRVFNAGEAFYVKGADVSAAMSHVLLFISTWHMPLLFALAGASTYLALGRRTRAEYAAERVRRILVPLVFGLLVLIPPQTWFGARFNSDYRSSYPRYLVSGDFLEFNIKDGGDYYGGLGTGHLWFILFLFIISMVALPLWRGRRRANSRLVDLSRLLARPWGWLIAGLAIVIGEALPDIAGKNIFSCFVFFGLGYVAMCSEEFMDAAERNRWVALALGIAGSIWWSATGSWRDGLADPSLALFVVALAGLTAIWLVIVGLLGTGRKLLIRPSRTLAYLAESSYPVYILHQTVIVVLAFTVVRLEVPWIAQWAILLVSSVALTFLCYEGVRRAVSLRPLFGMRPRAETARRKGGSYR